MRGVNQKDRLASPRLAPGLPHAVPRAAIVLGVLCGTAPSATAADLSGSADVTFTSTDNVGLRSDFTDQQYTLGLFQTLTPYLSLRVGYQYFDLGTTFEDGISLYRRSRQPLAELVYNRDRVSGRVSLYQLTVDDTLETENLDRRSLAANLSWKPRRWPGFNLNFRDDQNLADVSALGTGVSSRLLELTTFYNRRFWTASYTFEKLAVDNASNQFATDQGRHEVRATAERSLWAGRFSLGLTGQLSRLKRSTSIGAGAELAEPITAVTGLYGVDTSPELGELSVSATLADGDLATPAAPTVDIGGANLFRNLGVDLGVTRPVTRLEVAVDTVSGPSVVWQVYHSRDNLFWEAVAGVSSSFDSVLLRYRIRFPQTEDRFFKAVNVSVNPAPAVLVAEIRALLDLGAEASREDNDSNVYRADAVASFRPARRVDGSVGFGMDTDETITAGIVRRDYRASHALARLTIGLAHDLDLNLGYRRNDSENHAPPVLLRTVNQYTANLDWKPLSTVNAMLTLSRRDESERTTLLQSLESARLTASLQLLPDLRYVADFDFSRLADPFAGRDRNSWTWNNTVEMRPLPSWTLSGNFTYTLNETPGGEELLRQAQYRVWTTWNATAYLTLGGTWWLTDQGGSSSLNQSYNLSYAPGDRLMVSATYQGFDERDGYATSTSSLGVTYRLFTQFLLFGNLSRSTTQGVGSQVAVISNLRAGLRLAF